MVVSVFVFLFFFLNAVQSYSCVRYDHPGYEVTCYNSDDGLGSSELTGFYKDSRGLLWISTFAGLSRYDGHVFEKYNWQHGLKDNNTEVIGEDLNGRIYIRSLTNIYIYAGENPGVFARFRSNGNDIASACPLDSNEVLVAYSGHTGLSRISLSGSVTTIPTAWVVFAVFRDREHTVFVIGEDGTVCMLQGNRLKPVSRVRPQKPFVSTGIGCSISSDGRLWTYGANNAWLYGYSRGIVSDSIPFPATGTYWNWVVGRDRHVYKADDSGTLNRLVNGHWLKIVSQRQVNGSIYGILEDVNERLWVATSSGLLSIRPKPYGQVSLTSPLVYYTRSKTGQVILRKDSLLYRLPGALAPFKTLNPSGVYVTRDRTVWYFSADAVYFLPYKGTLQPLDISSSREGPEAIYKFKRGVEDDSGGVWITTYSGVFRYAATGTRFYHQAEGISENALYTNVVDRNGIVYFSGTRVFAGQGGRFTDVSARLHLPIEISRLTTDQLGRVWFCQSTGVVYRIDCNNGRFSLGDSLVLSLTGMPFIASSMCFDTANNMWISDDNRLYCYRYLNGSYKSRPPAVFDEHLTNSPLLYSDDCNNLQIISHPLAAEGLRTYAAAGLLAGYAEQMPRLLLTDVRLFKQPFNWTSAGFRIDALGVPQALTLDHDKNFLKFSFTGILPQLGAPVIYRYRLHGYDRDWSPATTVGEAEYTGLPAGYYTLEIEAASPGGGWNQPLRYSFTILEVWYRTWWAIICWILLCNALIGMLIYVRFRVLKRRARMRRLMMEEKMKALRAQINPHFLQNTFNFLSNQIYTTSSNAAAVKVIDQMSVYFRNVLDLSNKSSVTLEEELEFTGRYLALQQQLMNIPFRYTIDIAEEVDAFDTRVPSMLLQPVVENALKYGIAAGRDNVLTVRIRLKGDYIVCLVRDTGNGGAEQSPGTPRSGRGIALTIDRMELFFSDKTNKPHFSRVPNVAGGSDVIILIPMN